MPLDTNELNQKLSSGKLAIASNQPMQYWEFSPEGRLQFTTPIDEFVQNGVEVGINKFTKRDAPYYDDMVFLYDIDKSTTVNKEQLDIEYFSSISDAGNTVIAVGITKNPMSKITLLANRAKLTESGRDVPMVLLNTRSGKFSEYNPDLNEVSSLLNFVKDEYIKGDNAKNNHINITNGEVLDNQSDKELLDNFKEFSKSLGYPIDNYNDINQEVTPGIIAGSKNNTLTHENSKSLNEQRLVDQPKSQREPYVIPSEELLSEFQSGGLLARTREYSNSVSGYSNGLIDKSELDKELGFLNTGQAKAQSTTMLSPIEHIKLWGGQVGLLYLKDESTVRAMFNDPVGTWVDRENFGNKIGSLMEPLPILSHKEFLEQFEKTSFGPRTNEIMSNIFPEGLVGTIIDNSSKKAKLELLAVTAYASEKQGKNLVPTILNNGKLQIYEPTTTEVSSLLNYAHDIYGLPIQETAKSIGYSIKGNFDLSKPLSPNDIERVEWKPKLQVQDNTPIKSGISNKENDPTEVVTDTLERLTKEATRDVKNSTVRSNLSNKDDELTASVRGTLEKIVTKVDEDINGKTGQYKLADKQPEHATTSSQEPDPKDIPGKKWIPLTPEEIKEQDVIRKTAMESAKKDWDEHVAKGGDPKIPPTPEIQENLTYKPKYYQPTPKKKNTNNPPSIS